MLHEKDKLAIAVREYRTAMKKAYDDYDEGMKITNRYKGSEGYNEDKAKVEARLKEKVDACKAEYRPKLLEVINDLREQVARAGLHVPTDEQLRLLKVMEMQQTLSDDIILLATRSLSSSPLAVEALRGIVTKKNARWPIPEVSSTTCTLSGAKLICDTLNTRIVNLLTYMERPGDGKRYVNDKNVPTQLISYDKEFDTSDECFQAFADVDNAQSKAFFEFLSRKETAEATA